MTHQHAAAIATLTSAIATPRVANPAVRCSAPRAWRITRASTTRRNPPPNIAGIGSRLNLRKYATPNEAPPGEDSCRCGCDLSALWRSHSPGSSAAGGLRAHEMSWMRRDVRAKYAGARGQRALRLRFRSDISRIPLKSSSTTAAVRRRHRSRFAWIREICMEKAPPGYAVRRS